MRLRLLVAAAAVTALPLMLGGVAASASSTVHAQRATPPVTTAALRNAPLPADCFDTWVISTSGTPSYLAVGTHGDLADMETYATCFNADEVGSAYDLNWYLISGNGGCLQFDTANGTITNESCDSGESVELWAHPSTGFGGSFWINLYQYENNKPDPYLADPLSSCGAPARAYLENPLNYPACTSVWYNN
jgi:hypothetical protein